MVFFTTKTFLFRPEKMAAKENAVKDASAPPMRVTGGPPVTVKERDFWVAPRFSDLQFIGEGNCS